MRSTTISELQWLHDSDVLSIQYDTSGAGGRSIQLILRCPDDSGYAPWEGRCLVLAARNVAGSKHLVYSVVGCEVVDNINRGVSSPMRESTLEVWPAAAKFNVEFTIAFVSGSVLEVICEELQVEVQERYLVEGNQSL